MFPPTYSDFDYAGVWYRRQLRAGETVRRLIIGGLTALAIGLGVTPVASAAPPGLADRICSMLDQGQSVLRVKAYVKESTGMVGQYADYNVSILTQQLAYETCPRHSGKFGQI